MAELNKNPNMSLRNMVFYRQDYLDEFNAIWEKQILPIENHIAQTHIGIFIEFSHLVLSYCLMIEIKDFTGYVMSLSFTRGV